MLEPKVIKTNDQSRAYVAEVDRLAADDPPLGTADGDRLELLAKLVEDYEKGRFRFKRPGPIEAIRFRMEEQGLRQVDLAPLLGGRNRDTLHIPADLLVRESEPAPYRTKVLPNAGRSIRMRRKPTARSGKRVRVQD